VTVSELGYFENLNFHLPADLTNGGTMLTTRELRLPTSITRTGVGVATGSTLAVGDQIVLIDASSGTQVFLFTTLTSLTEGYKFTWIFANKKLVLQVTEAPPQPAKPFTDGATLTPGGNYTAPSGNPSFCLGDPDTTAITMRIDDLAYAVQPRADNTCFEISSRSDGGRALVLASGAADINTSPPGVPLLMARNGELVLNGGNATIRASLDPVCTSTRVSILGGEISAPDWITTPMPETGCPADALTPEQESFLLPDGELACAPASLKIKGSWANLTVDHTQEMAEGQQYFLVAGRLTDGWWMSNVLNEWKVLDDPFLPLATATQSGPMTLRLIEELGSIPGTELYIGYGTDVEEMMMEGRYCGVLRLAP